MAKRVVQRVGRIDGGNQQGSAGVPLRGRLLPSLLGALATGLLAVGPFACGGEDGTAPAPVAGPIPAGCAATEVECQSKCYAADALPASCKACTGCTAEQRCVDGACADIGKPVTPPPAVLASCTEAFKEAKDCTAKAGRTFYVSTSGQDDNDGLSEAKPLRTLAKASSLEAAPGDRVLFKCGDKWQNEVLEIGRSGDACAHVVYGSYPAACDNPPIFSGAASISGWKKDTGSVWVADLSAGENAGKFPKGLNQLFKGEDRLPLGRWPNTGQNGTDVTNGYSHIDRHTAKSTSFEDDELPALDWTGAVLRYQWIRWQLVNRLVTGTSGKQLTVEGEMECVADGGGCGKDKDGGRGWGYVLTSHRGTLDVEGEWYFDNAANKVYLLSASEPTAISGSALEADSEGQDAKPTRGLVILGANLQAPIHHVVVENLRVEAGYRNGITLPINFKGDDPSELVIRCNTVRNVDGIGLSLQSWVYESANGVDGWRGGRNLLVANNVIDGANHFGVYARSRDSSFEENLVRDIGLAENLGRSGLGCDFKSQECTENGGGFVFPRGGENPQDNTLGIALRRNRIQRTAYTGVDIFGESFVLEENVIDQPCATKGDCGAIRTFGRDNLGSTPAKDITLRKNLISNVVGVTDGASAQFSEQFGFGLYIDHFSANVTADSNVISGTSGYAILYQSSSGKVTGNILFGAQTRQVFGAFQADGPTAVSAFTGNVLVATKKQGLVLFNAGAIAGSDGNWYLDAYGDKPFYQDGPLDLAGFRAATGGDGASKAAWYTQKEGETPKAELFVNDTAAEKQVTLTKSYVDVDQKAVTGTLTLAPFSGRVLVVK